MREDKKNKYLKRILKKLRLAIKSPYTYVIIFVIASLIAATVIVMLSEPNHPDGEIGSWHDAVWHTIVAVVAAYYDFYMKTVPGRLASLVLLLFGMAIWTIIIGYITSRIMEMQTKNNRGLKKLKRMKDHFIICGWRPGFDKILDSVLKTNTDITPDMMIMVNKGPLDQIEQIRQDYRFKGINYIAGDFSDGPTLEKAYIKTAKRALVISDTTNDQSQMETDSRTVLAVLTIKNLNPKVYIAAELLDTKFNEHLKLANCDEILLTQEYEYSLLATASSGMGYSNVIRSLLSDDADSGVLIDNIPSRYQGKSYKELSDFFDNNEDSSEVLIGLLSESRELVLSPEDSFVIPDKAKAVLIRAKESA